MPGGDPDYEMIKTLANKGSTKPKIAKKDKNQEPHWN